MDQQRDSLRKTFKYKLKPTPDQEQALDSVLWHCRALYNAGLEQRKTWWERGQGKSATYYQQKAELPDLKAACPDYAEINAQVLQDVLLRLDRTYQAFFRRVAWGEIPGFPRFQGRGRYTSFTYPQVGEHGGARLDNGFLVLSKIGRIAARWSRPLKGTPKTVTISREADGWYACFSCAEVPTAPLPLTGCETGIDVGLKVFLIAADRESVENPRHYRTAERRLAQAQRRVSRRKKGSHRRCKAVRLLARAHQKVRRARADFHHKTALALVRRYDTIYLEELQVRNLSRRPEAQLDGTGDRYLKNGASRKAGLNKSINDAGWYAFRIILACKAAWAGKRVQAIPPAYTSQDCSGVLPDGRRCTERVVKSLSMRTHVCPSCGLVLDRDENAARNILRAGQARQALTQRGAAYVA